MGFLKRLFTKKPRCRYCNEPFTPAKDFPLAPCCSRECAREYNIRYARVQPRIDALPPRPRDAYRYASPTYSSQTYYTGRSSARPDLGTRQYPYPFSNVSYQQPTVVYPPIYVGPSGSNHPTPSYPTPYSHHTAYPPIQNYQHAPAYATTSKPATAIPPHLQMARATSTPAHPRIRQRPRGLDVPQRPSSAGHTPGTALRPLLPDTCLASARPPESHNHRRGDHGHRTARQDFGTPSSPVRQPEVRTAIVAPVPIRPQPPIQIVTSPTQSEASELPVPESATAWHFRPPPTPSVSSTSSADDDEEPHGGFYDENGYPVRVQFGADGEMTVESPATAGWKTASSTTLVPTPRARKPADTSVGTPYKADDYGMYSPQRSVTPRPKTAARRGPRPRSNSFGGY